MTGPALSERDLAVLRSFARRIDPSDAGAHNNLGVLYYQKRLIPEAIAAFGRALELDPKMQVAQDNLEIAYQSSGYYDRRVTELQEQLRDHPEDRDARWELGRAYASLGHQAEAVAEFEALLGWHPGDVPTLIQLGLSEKARGDMDTAAEWFRRACERDPESPVALFYHGETLYNRGLNDAALAALEEAIQRNPEHADAHYLLAFVYGDMGRHDDARAATKRALALNPTLGRAQANLSLTRTAEGRRTGEHRAVEAPRPAVAEGRTLAHFNLGMAFRQKAYYTEALREYRLALDQGEDRRLTLQAMAEVHLLRRDLNAALELYDRLVQEFDDSPKLWNERGVCLHQAGRRDEAAACYRTAGRLDHDYALAWNNLGVLLSHDIESDEAADALRHASRGPHGLRTGRLNLALLLFQRRRFQLALEAYRQVLAQDAHNAVAWNGVGLVLMELRRYDDARNAFSRAVEADPDLASAHYNLSFALSQLGEFDGALRATKRALELEPFYVPQKYQLTIDLQYEDPTIAIVPEISADVTGEEVGEDFAFDERILDAIFHELAPAEPPPPEEPHPEVAALTLARDYINKGLLELATAEVNRARARGAPAAAATVLLGDIFAKRGLHGEALERYREARHHDGDDPDAMLGEVRALLALERGADAAELADRLAAVRRDDVEVLVACARVRLALGDPVRALDCIREAQGRAPGRADLLQLQARVARRLGEREAALEAYQAALQLDGALVQVWFEVGSLEEERENWSGARLAYARALDLLPTFMDAGLALADLLRRMEMLGAAVAVLVDLLRSDPYDLQALTLLGRVLLEDHRPERALEALDRVLKFEPGQAEAQYHRGLALARLRHFAEAVAAWEQVIQSAPGGELAGAARAQIRSARDLVHILSPSEGG